MTGVNVVARVKRRDTIRIIFVFNSRTIIVSLVCGVKTALKTCQLFMSEWDLRGVEEGCDLVGTFMW